MFSGSSRPTFSDIAAATRKKDPSVPSVVSQTRVRTMFLLSFILGNEIAQFCVHGLPWVF